MWVAGKLLGAAGTSGTYAMAFQRWILCFGQASAGLRDEIEACTDWLANNSPPWSGYCAIMAARLVSREKCIGMRPVGIREMSRRLFEKIVL